MFTLSSDPDDFRAHGEHYVGTMSPNFVGTVFSVNDFGLALPRAAHKQLPDLGRRQAGVVQYEVNILGRVPNAMAVLLQSRDLDVDAKLEDVASRPVPEGEASQVHRCTTKKPKWNDALDAWTMDFRGRVKVASKKNFQIACDDFPDQVLLLFGKYKKDLFSLDFRAPFCMATALGVALTTFADKLIVT